MEYLNVAQARERPGLRLVLTAGVPGPWGEAAKALLKLRGVPYLAVEQRSMEPNAALVAWTGRRDAPIACLDDEPPLAGWLDILLLAERLGAGPSLLPQDEAERALCLGFSLELAGADGFGWNRRLGVVVASLGGVLPGADAPAPLVSMLGAYGVDGAAVARAPGRIAAILAALADRLRRQREAGSDYLIGAALTALDVYWACFSMMVRPLGRDVNPMPDWLLPLYSATDPVIDAALDPILLAHRDRVYADHIGLPLDY